MSRQSEATDALVNARETLRVLLPYRSTVYYTIVSRSRSGDTIHVQFLAPRNGSRVAEILNISNLVAAATLHPCDPSHPGTVKLTFGGDTPAALIRHLGRILHGDLSQGDSKRGHAEHEWLYARDTLA